MSQIHAKSPRHCANKKLVNISCNLQRKLFCTFFLSSILVLIIIIIIICFILVHPTKPEFFLKEADIIQLAVISGTHLLNSSIQLTLLSKNPNHKVGIYYQQIQVYASYKGQQITNLDSSLPPFYQDTKDTNFLSALLVANALPVAPWFNYDLGRDQVAGTLVLNFMVNGLLQWKLGTWVSGNYRFTVNCVTTASLVFSPSAPPFAPKRCSTTI